MANLRVTINEQINLENQEYGGMIEKTFSGINEVLKRIVVCPASADTTVATFQTATSTADNAIDLENVKYIRLTNLDSTNSINLSLQVAGAEGGTANMSTTILVKAGESFILGTIHDGIALDDSGAGIVTALTDLESLLVDPSANAVKVEVMIASA